MAQGNLWAGVFWSHPACKPRAPDAGVTVSTGWCQPPTNNILLRCRMQPRSVTNHQNPFNEPPGDTSSDLRRQKSLLNNYRCLAITQQPLRTQGTAGSCCSSLFSVKNRSLASVQRGKEGGRGQRWHLLLRVLKPSRSVMLPTEEPNSPSRQTLLQRLSWSTGQGLD